MSVIEFPAAQGKPADPGFNLKPCSADSVIAAGQVAWGRLNERHTWRDWKILGAALLCGRTEAMAIAKAKTPNGAHYARAFSEWIEWYHFAGIAKSTRAQLLQCMENIEAIEQWFETLTPAKLLKLNHPAIVLSAWKRATREPAAAADGGTPVPTVSEIKKLIRHLPPADLEVLVSDILRECPVLVPRELREQLLRQHHRHHDDLAYARIAKRAREITAFSHHPEQHVDAIRKAAAEILRAVEPKTKGKKEVATPTVGDLSAWPKAMCLPTAGGTAEAKIIERAEAGESIDTVEVKPTIAAHKGRGWSKERWRRFRARRRRLHGDPTVKPGAAPSDISNVDTAD